MSKINFLLVLLFCLPVLADHNPFFNDHLSLETGGVIKYLGHAETRRRNGGNISVLETRTKKYGESGFFVSSYAKSKMADLNVVSEYYQVATHLSGALSRVNSKGQPFRITKCDNDLGCVTVTKEICDHTNSVMAAERAKGTTTADINKCTSLFSTLFGDKIFSNENYKTIADIDYREMKNNFSAIIEKAPALPFDEPVDLTSAGDPKAIQSFMKIYSVCQQKGDQLVPSDKAHGAEGLPGVIEK